MLKKGMRKVEYNPDTKSVAVPAILHSNELVLNVKVAKELFKQLQTKEPKITPALKKKLMFLYTHTPK
jgi:predicted DNA-binding protein (MmcQ/YjbR family)